jgi:hypothetical protein
MKLSPTLKDYLGIKTYYMIRFCEMLRIGKFKETESGLVVA